MVIWTQKKHSLLETDSERDFTLLNVHKFSAASSVATHHHSCFPCCMDVCVYVCTLSAGISCKMLSILFTVSLLPRGHYIAYKLDNQQQVCVGDMAEWLKQAGSTLSPSMCLISSLQVEDEELLPWWMHGGHKPGAINFLQLFVTYLRDLLVYLWTAVAMEHAVGCCPRDDHVGLTRQPASQGSLFQILIEKCESMFRIKGWRLTHVRTLIKRKRGKLIPIRPRIKWIECQYCMMFWDNRDCQGPWGMLGNCTIISFTKHAVGTT